MTDSQRLQKNTDFKKVYAKGSSLANYHLVLFFKQNEYPYNRAGFSASKKVGNSVTRNRARRLMKESFRKYHANLRDGFDLVFIARMNMKDAAFKDVDKAMYSILKKSKLLK